MQCCESFSRTIWAGRCYQGLCIPGGSIQAQDTAIQRAIEELLLCTAVDKIQSDLLMLASNGLRISELLSADIDRQNRMLMPQAHDSSTKAAWVSFYNDEAEALLREYDGELSGISRNTVAHVFAETANKTGIDISTQTLRFVFAREMGLRGVQDRYVDAFCGRVPGSVLARHYSDFNPEEMKTFPIIF